MDQRDRLKGAGKTSAQYLRMHITNGTTKLDTATGQTTGDPVLDRIANTLHAHYIKNAHQPSVILGPLKNGNGDAGYSLTVLAPSSYGGTRQVPGEDLLAMLSNGFTAIGMKRDNLGLEPLANGESIFLPERLLTSAAELIGTSAHGDLQRKFSEAMNAGRGR